MPLPNEPVVINPAFGDASVMFSLDQTLVSYWMSRLNAVRHYNAYFSGKIFNTQIQEGDEPTDLFPVGFNLVRMLCLSMADSVFGDWREGIISFEPIKDIDVSDDDRKAAELLQLIMLESNANVLLWENALDAEVYGGGAIKVSPSLTTRGKVVWSRVAPDSFFPVWSPDDPDELFEVYVTTPIHRAQAKELYNINLNKDVGTRVEHWTRYKYETFVDDKRIEAYSGNNPWGIVPFVYIPRFRSTYWFGESLVDEISRIQDEINIRLADIGDSIEYSSHPIRYGYNLQRPFNADNFPVGPNVLWDLGRVVGDSPPPTVGVLEAKNPIPQGTSDYVSFLYDWSRTSVFAPPIAFGEDNGGGQRSGITLEIRMLPLMRYIKRSRAYKLAGYRRLALISAMILKQKNFSTIPVRPLNSILEDRIQPVFASTLPRDRTVLVDEVVKRLSTNPPTISLETALKILGEGTSEVERILDMVEEMRAEQAEQSQQETANDSRSKSVQ